MKPIRYTWRSLADPLAVADLLMQEVDSLPAPTLRPCSIDRCKSPQPYCRRVQYAHDYSGLGWYCSHPHGWTCPHNAADWKPSGRALKFRAPERVRLANSPTTAELQRFVRRALIGLSEDESVGTVARAFVTGDWGEVDASKPRNPPTTVNAHRESEQLRLFAAISERSRDAKPRRARMRRAHQEERHD